MKVTRKDDHDGRLKSIYFQFGKIIIAVGWVMHYKGTEKMIAFNRNYGWVKDKRMCLSVFRLRLGLKLQRNESAL